MPVQDPFEAGYKGAFRLASEGRVDDAMELLSGLLLKDPKRTETLLAMARILLPADRMQDAAEVLNVLVAHVPSNGEVRRLLASVFARMRLMPKAEEQFKEALRIDPFDVDAWIGLGQVMEQWGRSSEACDAILRAVALRRNDLELSCHAAGLLQHAGRSEQASDLLLNAPPSVGDRPEARLLEAMFMPIIPTGTDEILARRCHLSETLKHLRDEGAQISYPERTVAVTLFQLGYHGLEDRALIEDTASTLLQVAPSLAYVSPCLDRRSTTGRRLRVGFVSSNMRVHSVGRVLNRFLKELDRERFEVLLFELPGKFGGGQEEAREMADRTLFLPNGLEPARAGIEAEAPDILVFPDFVLEPFSNYLAYSRLAPVQCSTWGHPGTSGRPSIDYWVSCEDWEPAGNERLYSEQLVRLSKPPMIASRLGVPNPLVTREELGLPEGRIYGCPQSLYKLHPEFDGFLGEVLRRDREAWMVLVGGIQNHWIETFKTRFSVENADVADRLIFMPHLSTERYLSLLFHCEVSLDPIHFGGANTSMEAFTMGLPVVTLPGGQLRNRQTLSFYNMMEFMPLVVDSKESYVEVAVRIGNDREYREELSREVHDRCHVLFDTVEVTRELEAFFEMAVKEKIGG